MSGTSNITSDIESNIKLKLSLTHSVGDSLTLITSTYARLFTLVVCIQFWDQEMVGFLCLFLISPLRRLQKPPVVVCMN